MATRKKPRDAYHHGDLREALLDAALSLVEERGPQGLSLRECARRAGVSHAAPKRHFADKNALMVAVARRGFVALADAGREALDQAASPTEGLDAYGVAYVRFAVDNPGLFRLMFTADLDADAADAVTSPEPSAAQAPDEAFALLASVAAKVANAPADDAVPAVAAWSIPHGLAMLILDGRIPPEHVATPEDVEALARRVLALWRGALGHGGQNVKR